MIEFTPEGFGSCSDCELWMNQNETDLRQVRAAEGSEMIALMTQGVAEALSEHKRAGRSVVVWDRKTR